MNRRNFLLGFAGTCAAAVATTQTSTATNIDNWIAEGVAVVPTMADLRTLDPNTVQATVWLSGYFAPLDGGEGLFNWDSTSTDPDNGGTSVANPMIHTGRWKRAVTSGPINARWFGVKGDGKTDDSAKMMQLRDYVRANVSKHQTICFPPGRYRYTNNRWLLGVRSVTIRAEGAKFENISDSSWNANKRPLNTRSIFSEDGDVPVTAPKTFASGYRFANAAMGDLSISMVTAGDENNFSAGDHILLLGFNQQQYSFPPNARYFQWNKVVSVKVGMLTLEDPLRYDFRSDDWEDSQLIVDGGSIFIGKARILKLTRPNFVYPRYIEIVGAEFLPNPNGGPDTMIVASDTLILRNVRNFGDAVPSENKKAIYEDCHFGGSEPDKICDLVRFSRCTFNGNITEATGVNTLIIEDCFINSGKILVAPRQLFLRRNSIIAPRNLEYGAIQVKESSPMQMLIFEDNVVHHDGALRHIVNTGLEQSMVIESTNSSKEIKIEGNGTNFNKVIQRIMIGSLLYAGDLSDWGKVTRISHDGTDWVIAGTWRRAPKGVWHFQTIQRYREKGTVQFGGVRPVFRDSLAPQLSDESGSGPVRIVLEDGFRFVDGYERRFLLGYVRKIVARVVSPYTGPDTNPVLTVQLNDGIANKSYIAMSLSQAGHAETRVDGVDRNPAAQKLEQLDVSKVSLYTTIYFRSGNNALSGADHQMPKLSVYFEVEPIEA